MAISGYYVHSRVCLFHLAIVNLTLHKNVNSVLICTKNDAFLILFQPELLSFCPFRVNRTPLHFRCKFKSMQSPQAFRTLKFL